MVRDNLCRFKKGISGYHVSKYQTAAAIIYSVLTLHVKRRSINEMTVEKAWKEQLKTEGG